MYHTVIPVTNDHNPIVVEGAMETQLIVFNAGPSAIEAHVWQKWSGKTNERYPENADEPNLKLELRAGSQKIIAGSFIRLRIKNSGTEILQSHPFAAIGVRILIPLTADTFLP